LISEIGNGYLTTLDFKLTSMIVKYF